MIDELRDDLAALKAEHEAYTRAVKILEHHAFTLLGRMVETKAQIVREISNQKPDGLASWELFVAAQREALVREGSVDPVTPQEWRQADEGPRPVQELDCLKP